MRSSMDVLGVVPTHDGGGVIDYVFYQPTAATPVRQQTRELHSDHDLLEVEMVLQGDTRAVFVSAGNRVSSHAAESTDTGPRLSAVQWRRASEVVSAGRRLGISAQGIVIALAVARQESGFRVLANDGLGADLRLDQSGVGASVRMPLDGVGTDHGSLGLFQQQWPWWGSMSQLMDPATSADLFYRALLRIPDWERLPLTVAAQRVQRSAYPDAYADDAEVAGRVYAELSHRPADALYLSSSDDAGCAASATASTDTGVQAGGGRGVVLPVPAAFASADRHNWGGHGGRWSSWHTGTDYSVPCGTPVLAATSGRVQIDTGQSWAGRWLVRVSQGEGQLSTWYAHMHQMVVRPGQHVRAGQQIGEVGALGNATGCHLHFEVHTRGGSIYGPDNVDPSTWLADHLSATRAVDAAG